MAIARRRILLWIDSGGLCNRLLNFSYVLAFAREHGFTVHHFFLRRYADYFRAFEGEGLVSWPAGDPMRPLLGWYPVRHLLGRLLKSRRAAAWLQRRGLLLQSDEPLPETGPGVLALLHHPRTIFWKAWDVRFDHLRARHRDWLRELFRPVPRIEAEVALACGEAPEGSLLIGVHMRRGDYQKWNAGRYYFAYAYYRAAMEALQRAAEPMPVWFLVASNEAIPPDFLEGLRGVALHGSEVSDLYALARCQVVAGPPSTYSDWAVFYGNGLRWVLEGELELPQSVQAALRSPGSGG